MSTKSHISLIDLSQQFPFEIDDKLKKEICFGESLIISCGHYEGDIEDGSSESWTCRSSTPTEVSEEVKPLKPRKVKEPVAESVKDEEKDEYNDFHFFFFPDCKKPPPKEYSKTSVLIEDGLPKINLTAQIDNYTCYCQKDRKGKCKCFTDMPCYCGAKSAVECTCRDVEKLCVCQPGPPEFVCSCETAEPCICDPSGAIIPECICEDVKKPCICPPFKSPYPVCICKKKPKSIFDTESSFIGEAVEGEYYEEVKVDAPIEPCKCQEPEPEVRCLCKKGKDCICRVVCICGLQRFCICESTDSINAPCKKQVGAVCSCDMLKQCICDAELPEDCTCFPRKDCTCGDPENCRCYKICDCKDPCLCDTAPGQEPKVCTCKPGTKLSTVACTCPQPKVKSLKKKRAGKHGYVWCDAVDPQHTYFDYAYDRHHLIEKKESEEKGVEILGLKDETAEIECAVHGVKAPPYEKKIRKPSLDCCSAVGGISISVEPLGEDKDKFLVQVVSYSSKEGAKTGSKLVSILDCNLHTMEENRTEHITKKNLTKERRSYMAICANGYYNKVTSICGDRDVVKRFYHTFEKAHDFLLEGANIVLMRYFGLSRYRGNVKTATVMMDGIICESIYVCHGVSQAIVNETPLFVVKVERHIIEPSGYIHQTMTVLTLRGYIVSHEWADNCYVLHLNPLLKIVPEQDRIEEHAPLRSRWREDLQLLSDYLDFKSTRTSEGGRYLTESGTLTGTVRDYLQAILMLRPRDTLTFTRHYFKSVLSALDLPHDEYFDPLSKHVRYYYFED